MKKKRRRLREPIRAALKWGAYIVAGMSVDLGTICTSLVLLENVPWMLVIGACLMLNIGLWYLFFRNEEYVKGAMV